MIDMDQLLCQCNNAMFFVGVSKAVPMHVFQLSRCSACGRQPSVAKALTQRFVVGLPRQRQRKYLRTLTLQKALPSASCA